MRNLERASPVMLAIHGAFKKTGFLFLILLFLISLSGCLITSSYIVNVSGLSAENMPVSKKRYILLPQDQNIQLSDLQFKEFARQINPVLAQKGFVQSDDVKLTDFIIFIDYGISNPKQRLGTYQSPVIGQTGISSSYSSGTYNSKTGSFSGSTYSVPTYGVTGYTSHTYSKTEYTRWLSLTAVVLKIGEELELGDELWQIKAVSTGSAGDLRTVFPALVTAMKDYIALDTRRAITVNVDSNDPSRILSVE